MSTTNAAIQVYSEDEVIRERALQFYKRRMK